MASMCKDYVEWYNEMNPAAWPTWEPGERVEPGAVGFFDRDKRFHVYHTLTGLRLTPERETGPHLHMRSNDFDIRPSVQIDTPIGPHPFAFADAEMSLRAKRKNASILQVDDAFDCELEDILDVLEGVRQALLDGEWEIDAVLVTRRVRSPAGFALIISERGQAVTLRAEAEISAARVITLASVGLGVQASRFRSATDLWDFGELSTPIFMNTIRVKTKWWARMIPGLPPPTGRQIIDHTGHAWSADKPPWNLQHLPDDARHYDASASSMRPEDLKNLKAMELFEFIQHLGVDDEEPPPEGGERFDEVHTGSGGEGAAVAVPVEAFARA